MTILEENNLIKAAELLYMSPSTAGSRLRAMEEELGFELFERRRGVKTALPTPKGQEFSRLSAQMLALWNEADPATTVNHPSSPLPPWTVFWITI
jgi:LysR family transcriptional regulator, cyn operon transcriptional activator